MSPESEKWFTVTLDVPQEAALERVAEELKKEGFGILTRADLHDAFSEKLGVAFRPYTILGACNPSLAHRALQEAPEIGLFLPCNVTVEEVGPSRAVVRLSDPETVLANAALGVRPDLDKVANDARARIQRVAASLRESEEGES